MVESKLDESLGMLEADNARRAREEVKIVREFGSWEAFTKQAEIYVKETKEPAILPTAPPTSS